jgi:hypothetical protein
MVALSHYHLSGQSFKMTVQAGVARRAGSYLRGNRGTCDAGQGIDE